VQLAKESLDTHGIKAIFLFSPHSCLFLFRPNFLDGFWTVFQKSPVGVVRIGGLHTRQRRFFVGNKDVECLVNVWFYIVI
jgi:hypothetical protein